MQVHSVISNTISEEILTSGHLSIRFLPDGFSVLLEDSSFQPVILNRFYETQGITLKSLVPACADWLQRHTLTDGFRGEVSITVGTAPATLVPTELFNREDPALYLLPVTRLLPSDTVLHKEIRNRPFVMVFAIPAAVMELAERFKGQVRIMPVTEVMISVAEQVNAADHQRGFILIEYQQGTLEILLVRDDRVMLANKFVLKEAAQMVYHTLNIIQQLGFDRQNRPLFYAGQPPPEVINTLKKYVRQVHPLSYHINGIGKSAIAEHIVLAEATKCE